mmetsp:Transcript_25474/g.75882  ORF Transcript_25474/g.75882 Transcript_25474/m.75882 type:complete len:244 (+) Transcript_25474:129-860(+)
MHISCACACCMWLTHERWGFGMHAFRMRSALRHPGTPAWPDNQARPGGSWEPLRRATGRPDSQLGVAPTPSTPRRERRPRGRRLRRQPAPALRAAGAARRRRARRSQTSRGRRRPACRALPRPRSWRAGPSQRRPPASFVPSLSGAAPPPLPRLPTCGARRGRRRPAPRAGGRRGFSPTRPSHRRRRQSLPWSRRGRRSRRHAAPPPLAQPKARAPRPPRSRERTRRVGRGQSPPGGSRRAPR